MSESPYGGVVYKTDADKVKVYDGRVRAAEEKRKDWEPTARDSITRYRNEKKPEQVTETGHRVNVTSGVSVIDTLFSSMTALDVYVGVTNVGEGTRDQERLATGAVNYEWRRSKVSKRAKKAIKDALLVGIGWVKVSYDYDERDAEVPTTAADVRESLSALVQDRYDNGLPPPTPEEIDDHVRQIGKTKTETLVVRDRLVVDYVPWDMVLWDPTAKQVEDVRWVCQTTHMRPEEVKSNPIFRAYCKRSRDSLKKLDDLDSDKTTYVDGEFKPDNDDNRVTVYELHDLETGSVCTWAKGKDFLLNETANPFAFKYDLEDRNPFVPLILRTDPEKVVGISDMAVMIPSLDELNIYRSKLASYFERFVPKVMATAGTFTEAGKQALKSREYGEVAETEEGRNIREDVDVLTPPALPAEVYQIIDRILNDIREASGVNELMRGLFPDRKRTATETAQVVAASAARQAEKSTNLEDFYVNIASRMLTLMQMFYGEDRIARVSEHIGPVEWQFSAEDITMDADFEIELTPKETLTRELRQQRAMAMANILGAFSNDVDTTQLARYIAEEFGLKPDEVALLLKLPEEQAAEQAAAIQQQADAAKAQQGVGPLDTGQSTAVPPDVLAAAGGVGGGALQPEVAQQVSESANY